jgi:outer membrane receptor protein involved in Fe transport
LGGGEIIAAAQLFLRHPFLKAQIMKTLSLSLSGLLLATTAMVAPGLAHAQDPAPATSAAAAQNALTAQQDPEQEVTEVEEVVVRGRFIPEPLRETSEVAAFLTDEDIQRTGDSTAAEALTRVTGLSIVEGRFVYVRGLGERYSSALLNGSPLPSPEPLQRVVPLDLFPSNILAGVTVQKTYSPNYPGEFGGGVIDLRTVDAPEEPFFNVEGGIGYHSETTGRENLTYYGSDTDWTGYDDGTRDVPGALRLAFARGDQIGPGAFDDEELQDIGQSLVNAPLRLLQFDESPVDWGAELSGGFSNESPIGTLGFVGVAGFDSSWRAREGVQQVGQLDAGALDPVNNYAFESNQNDVRANLLGSISLTRPDHEIKWTNFYVHSTTKEARTREGPSYAAGGSVQRTDYTEWFERELISTQLAGEHFFMDGDLGVNWRAAYAKSTRDAPYETRFGYGLNDVTGLYSADLDQSLISFSSLEDEVVSGGVDVSYTLPLSSVRDAIFSAGVAYLNNDRDSIRRDLTFRDPTGYYTGYPQGLNSRVDYLFSDFNINPNGLVIQEVTSGGSAPQYLGELTVNAAYVQADIEIIPLVRISGGVRFEDGEQTVNPINIFGTGLPFVDTAIEEQYWLPAATVTWNFYEDMQLRLGASKTIGRPQFRELAPQSYTDPESDRSFIGNPYLVDTEILNVDARYEWYFERGQYFTLGAFYKKLDRPVESTIYEITALEYQQTFLNAPQAQLYGVEIDGKKYFEFPDSGTPFIADKRWLIQANYTWSDSEVQVEAGDTVRSLFGLGNDEPASFYISDGSPLQDQSEHVANLQFGWEDDVARSQATFIVNYVSERITARGPGIGGNRLPDFMQEPGIFLDFVYRKDFTVGERDLGVKVELRNLLDTEFDEYQELGNKIRVNNYDLGSSASISLTARF